MTLLQKLLAIRKECSYLKKDNEGYQFKFTSSSQVLGTLRHKMDELGVLLVPRILEHSVQPKPTKDKQGNPSNELLTILKIQYTWIDADDQKDTLVCDWIGQGLDTGEKGVGKALTYAEKYFLLKFFNIATDKDDPDSFQEKKAKSTTVKPNAQTTAAAQVTPEESAMQLDISKKIKEMVNGDVGRARKVLEKVTEFIGKENKLVPGVTECTKLKGKRLTIAKQKIYDYHTAMKEGGDVWFDLFGESA